MYRPLFYLNSVGTRDLFISCHSLEEDKFHLAKTSSIRQTDLKALLLHSPACCIEQKCLCLNSNRVILSSSVLWPFDQLRSQAILVDRLWCDGKRARNSLFIIRSFLWISFFDVFSCLITKARTIIWKQRNEILVQAIQMYSGLLATAGYCSLQFLPNILLPSCFSKGPKCPCKISYHE